MELDVNEVKSEGGKSLGWGCRLDREGAQALWSGIWSSLSRQQEVWKVLGQSVMMKAFIKSTLAAVRRG